MKKMKIIPVRTFGINSKKHNWGITPPMPLGKARKASKKDKRLNYKQARKKYGIKPYGDYDKDGRLNIHDCKPFDPKKHGVYRKYADRPVHSYAVPGLTQEKVFKKAEALLPVFQREEGEEGGLISNVLTGALLERENLNDVDLPFKQVAGVHKIELPASSSKVPIAHRYIGQYLQYTQPDKIFKFSQENPKFVTVIDPATGKSSEKKISKVLMDVPSISSFSIQQKRSKDDWKEQFYAKSDSELSRNVRPVVKPPSYITNLLTEMPSGKPAKVYITDDPIDVMMKSSWGYVDEGGRGLKSCELMPERFRGDLDEADCPPWGGMVNYWRGNISDIHNKQAVAYLYLGDKKPGKDIPSGRVALRWGTDPYNTRGGKFIGIEPSIYGLQGEGAKQGFRWAVQDIIKKKNAWNVPIASRKHWGYVDSVAHSGDFDKFEEVQTILEDLGYETEPYDDYDDYDSDNIDMHHPVGAPSVYTVEYNKPTTEDIPYYKAKEDVFSKEGKGNLTRPIINALARDPAYETRAKLLKLKDERKNLWLAPSETVNLLAFAPERQVWERTAYHPTLKQPAISRLLKSGGSQVKQDLYYNPAITYQQRKQLAPGTGYNLPLTSDTHPRVAREILKIGKNEINLPYVAEGSESVSALQYVFDNAKPEEKKYLLRNENTPDYMINMILSEGKVTPDDVRRMLRIRNRDISPELAKKIYNMYKHNTDIIGDLITYADTKIPSNVYDRILRRAKKEQEYYDIFKTRPNVYSSKEIVSFLADSKPELYESFLPRSSTLEMYSRMNTSARKDFIKAMIERTNENKRLTDATEPMIRAIKGKMTAEEEEYILNSLSKGNIKNETIARSFIRTLIGSDNERTKQLLIKRFG